MMKLLIRAAILGVFSFSFILSSFTLRKTPGINLHAQIGQGGQKLYFLGMSGLGTAGTNFATNYNVQSVMLIGQASIDPANDLNIREDLLKARITSLFPNPNDSGMAMLDWEGKGISSLSQLSPDDPQFQVVVDKFIAALKFSRALRPNVKWTFYGLPYREYWNLNSLWEQRNLKLIPLFRLCDMISPSLYNPYLDAESKGHDKTYVHGNMQLALKIGSIVNRPVLPLITHRLPDNRLIPMNEFIEHTRAILNEQYNGIRPAGVIWWDSDQYSYNTKSQPLVSEVGSKENFVPYHDKLITTYGSGVVRLLK